MNSEVRELIAEMRETARNPFASSNILTVFIRDWADKLEAALLARTEAGADGAAMAALQRESDKSMGVGFDQWFANPYTAVLLKSIAEDYVPRPRPQDASGDVVPVLFGRDADADWYVDAGTKSICVDVDFDPARQLSLILKQDGTVAWSIFVQEPDSSTTKATGPSVMNPGFYEALSYIAMQAKEAK